MSNLKMEERYGENQGNTDVPSAATWRRWLLKEDTKCNLMYCGLGKGVVC